MTDQNNDNGQTDIALEAVDAALREDVRELGGMVGKMLAEQGGEEFFRLVEQVRVCAIERRGQAGSVGKLEELLSGSGAQDAAALARAFSVYFHMVNVAERVHRIRRRREYQLAGAGPQPDSLAAVLAELRAAGVTIEEVEQWLGRLDIEPVFTAHPTEAVRRSLLEKEQEIVRALVEDFNRARTPAERAAGRARMQTAITVSWQTAETSAERPTVQDELDHVGFYLGGPLYGVLPVLYENLAQALSDTYGHAPVLPRILRFGNWVGGDMDGNPNVGADTIRESLQTQRRQVIGRYRDECAALARLLSQTGDRVAVSEALRDLDAQYTRMFPGAADRLRVRHANMPYRKLLGGIGARLAVTAEQADGGYADASGFAEDIRIIADSLRANKGSHAGLFAVERLLRRVTTFGFHLARLDVRQDSRAHDDALAELFQDPEWSQRDADERASRLRPFADGSQCWQDVGGECAAKLADVFGALAQSRASHGSEALGPYIISMARSAADVLAVLALARHGGLVEGDAVPLDIVPLFETVDDLRHAGATLQNLMADSVYKRHLASRANKQMVMLGYSDSGKDGGILAARWNLQQAQVELLALAGQHQVQLGFFHGRGGSVTRGGSQVTAALMASPIGAVAGRLRVTEQGEVIHRKYGIRALALRTLEQSVGAVLKASLRPRQQDAREPRWREQMQGLAQASRARYRALVTANGFVDWFREATPIDVIERMTLGSRPASRRTMRGVGDLRAIPWVFAWTQCRSIMPAWYGLGTAIEQGIAEHGSEAMAEMARDWPFLSTLLADVEMAMAKTDLAIAESFSRLSKNQHAAFFPQLAEEFRRSRDGLLAITRKSELLQDEPRLAQSIRLRNPYIDPMSLMQVDLLQRWRGDGSKDDERLAALIACVNGVAQGMQNTG